VTTQLHRTSPEISENPSHLSNEDIRRLLVICDQDFNKQNLSDIVRILANTGLRVGELRDLCWSNVNFTKSLIQVVSRKTMYKRNVPVGPKTIQVFKARHIREPKSDFAFDEGRGGILSLASRQFRIVAKQLGVGPVSFHALRRSFALRLASPGVDPAVLSLILGYKMILPTRRSFLTLAQKYACAVTVMARLEEF